MFSIENEFDHTIITIVDNDNRQEDAQVIMSDEYVYVRQYNAKSGRYDVIALSPFMFNEILASMKLTDGVYVTEDLSIAVKE